MGQACGNMLSNCGLNCFFQDVSKEKSNQIDKDLSKEKTYYKKQVNILCVFHLLKKFTISNLYSKTIECMIYNCC